MKYRSNMDNFLSLGESEEAPCRQASALCALASRLAAVDRRHRSAVTPLAT